MLTAKINKLSCTLLFLLLASLPLRAEEVRVLNGDFDRDGSISSSDVTTLASMCVARISLQQGEIGEGKIEIRTVTQFTTTDTSFLMGDMNGDGRLTVSDLTTLIGQVGHTERYLYAVIREGKIVMGYYVGQLFITLGEDELIDDGEEEF